MYSWYTWFALIRLVPNLREKHTSVSISSPEEPYGSLRALNLSSLERDVTISHSCQRATLCESNPPAALSFPGACFLPTLRRARVQTNSSHPAELRAANIIPLPVHGLHSSDRSSRHLALPPLVKYPTPQSLIRSSPALPIHPPPTLSSFPVPRTSLTTHPTHDAQPKLTSDSKAVQTHPGTSY